MNSRDTTFIEVPLGDGTPGRIRPLTPEDRGALLAGFDSLSPESRIRRFFFEKQALSETELHRLTHPDGIDHLALVLEVSEDGQPAPLPIAVARCFRDPHDSLLAEVAIVTREEWHGLGVGTALLRALSAAAWAAGIRRWNAALFCDHRTMRNLLARIGDLSEDRAVGSGIVEIVCALHPTSDRSTPPSPPVEP